MKGNRFQTFSDGVGRDVMDVCSKLSAAQYGFLDLLKTSRAIGCQAIPEKTASLLSSKIRDLPKPMEIMTNLEPGWEKELRSALKQNIEVAKEIPGARMPELSRRLRAWLAQN